MLRFLIFIKHHCKFLWNLAEYGNGILVGWFYGRRIVSVVSRVLTETSSVNQEYRLLRLEDVSEVCTLFLRQPENSYLYFNPHAFDEKTIRRLLKNPSFLMMGVFDGNKLIGYFFLRFFMNRHSFTGYLVDYNYQGQGIARKMGRAMFRIAWTNHFRTFATVSRNNSRALAAYRAINDFKVVKELPDNYIYIEYLKDKVK